MRTATRTIMIALALSCGIVAMPLAEEVQLPALYKSLADKNHYALVEGLKEARADVKCSILEQLVAAFPDAAGKPIAVTYTWSRPDPNAAPTKKMTVSGVPETLPDLVARLTNLFKEAEDFVIPDPPFGTIVGTEATAVSEGGKITVKGTAKAPADPIKNLLVEIDGTTYQVLKMDMDLGEAHVVIESTHKDLGGKWGVETSSIQYPQYKKVIKYEYAQVEGFWLPSKISVDFLGADGKSLQPTFVYDFSNWTVVKAS